ncbi:ATP-binding protein [Paenibacillus filicis]|uniref:histidine kinase n=1 Tax=Paenibacillus gyeongsangnamensis TaxID=3388067 RepID=A0ABT4QFM2_9BACL|nr:ATP-binding protein [Paenibacillus filicis]MCZ8515608.1 ATP-binding protein [Paenibacillus filicis]
MFEKTRRSLTIFFSVMLALILLLMTVLFYVVLSQTLHRNQNAAVDGIYDKAVKTLEHRKKEPLDRRPPGPGPGDRRSGGLIDLDAVQSNELMFLVGPSGDPIFGSSYDDEMRTFWTAWLSQNIHGHGLPVNHSSGYLVERGDDTYFLKAYPWPDINGILLAGQNISGDTRLLSQMRLALLLFSVCLLAVASGMGYLLAGRSMVPIVRAYKRQQDFTADASHELRTPLSVMQSSVEILGEEQEALPPFHRKVLSNMDEEVHRMIRLTESLLTLARSDSDAVEILREPIGLRGLAQDAVEKLRPLAERKRIALELRHAVHAGGPDTARLDGERVRQLLVILLDNAIKYTSEGGSVTLETALSEKGARFVVTDTGIGIPEDQIPHIFERFYRIDKARSRQEGGTGLGLSIAKWIVDAHGGTIQAESGAGRGSRFTVLLPEA